MNCTVGLTNCAGLNGNFTATLDRSFNFLVLLESPFTWKLGKRTFFPSKAKNPLWITVALK